MANKKVKTLADIVADNRIVCVQLNYDGKGKHMIECKDGYKFENERTVDIGTIKELVYSVNNWLDKQ